jgi:hypothetical protein
MIGRLMGASAALMLSGCAFQQQVHRYGVDYNEALSSMSNEQTLLNILRASKGMPTHFSSVNRFNGTLSMKASGSVNGALRGSGLTTTDTTGSSLSTATTVGTSAAPAGLTTTNSVVTTPGATVSLVNALAEGVDVFTPQIGGELNSGTGFEVQVFDQQKFYQGILSAVPFQTVEMLINQGFEPDLVANLLIARVDFYVEENGKKSGEAVASYRNDASDRQRFQWLIDCHVLDVVETRAPATKIAPISRLDLGTVAGKDRLTLEQLALFDGEKFGLSEAEGISPDGSTDKLVYVVKPGAKNRVPRLVARSCKGLSVPKAPNAYQAEAQYLGDGWALVGEQVDGMAQLVRKKVVFEIVFRSPEAVLRAVGEMVRRQGQPGTPKLALCPDGGTDCSGILKVRREPVFEVSRRRERGALVSARFLNDDYSVPASGYRSMQVISIIQQLINLQKESTERALSIPVRALP